MNKWIAFVLMAVSFAANAELEFTKQRVFATVPGIKVSSLYVTIQNTGRDDVSLVSAQSSVSKHAELHESSIKNSRMTMRKVDEIKIKAGENVVLQPNGKHIMLIGLHKRLKKGDKVSVTFTDDKGGQYVLDTTVTNGHSDDSHHHMHGSMKSK